MRLISWNVNGIRAAITKGFYDIVKELDADVFSIQESKMQEGQVEIEYDTPYVYYNSAERKGYSGVMCFSKTEPLSVTKGGVHSEIDLEGRVLTLEYPEFYLVNVYTPNSKEKLKRVDERMVWDEAFCTYVNNLRATKPVIICGDLNVAHNEIDLKNPKTNRRNAGFSDEERARFGMLLDAGFKDTYRTLYPEKVEYSWWSYRFRAREKNTGWRIDYFVVSNRVMERVKDSVIHTEVMGSDHCPVSILFE